MAYEIKRGLSGEEPGRQIARKIQIRLMWPLSLLLLLNSLDRVNISFGALQTTSFTLNGSVERAKFHRMGVVSLPVRLR